MKFELIGNPNVGKTTFYNSITNSNSQVMNYSGTTVDIQRAKISGTAIEVIDLPGIRTLVPHSEDEMVAVKSFIENEVNGVINIVDSGNLKRNLQLSIQILESGQPTLLVLNMKDELLQKGVAIDQVMFEKYFCKSVHTQANKTFEHDEIVEALSGKSIEQAFRIDYDALESFITKIEVVFEKSKRALMYPSRFYALQLLAKNPVVYECIEPVLLVDALKFVTEAEQYILREELATSLTGYLFKVRRNYIQDALDKILMQSEITEKQCGLKASLDNILLHPVLGSLTFLLVFYMIYFLTFAIGDVCTAFLEEYPLTYLEQLLESILTFIHMPPFFVNLLINGAFAGFATIIMFMPQIILVFFFLAILEGSGYMARSVIVFDKLFSKFGLNGKAIVPMMLGLGCSVPAIMAARTIKDPKERLTTQLIVPFISCAARLEIYIFFIAIFFEKYQALILLGINILGAVVALLCAKLLSSSIFKKKDSFFLVELPPFRTINMTYIYKITSNKVKQFLNNAGKFIVIGSIIIALLLSLGPTGIVDDINDSFFAIIGKLFAWMFIPLGFGTWEATSTLITGFLAKELVVADLGVLVAHSGSIEEGIHALFTWQSALSFMVFNLLYIPCLSTVATMRAEMKTWKWPLFSIGFSMVVAYIVSFIVYRMAMLF